ncbi:hypothetical protein FVE67_02320 [Thermosulfurimonas marina]|uniref:Peptidase zinc-dependent n=1 Tax=Thermosulfurimonas marina TaxID=2047767 RepID=A0A6H1WR78_9BACT|nr:hypothetical protein [Thermosulfurimonas marina]QJA05702.1 hypothetical protein FVE67_02320 [Thermosulfurimonas marina]
MRRVLVVPIGRVFGPWLERFLQDLSNFWQAQLELAHPVTPPPAAFHPRLRKFFAPYLVEYLRTLSREVDFVLGVCGEELYSPRAPVVFTEVSFSSRSALISARQLQEFLFGPEPERVFVERLHKEAVRALGHLLGLGPCPNPRCVMHPPSSLMELDLKGPEFCPECRMRLRLLQVLRGELRGLA